MHRLYLIVAYGVNAHTAGTSAQRNVRGNRERSFP